MKILIPEDEPIERLLLERATTRLGHQVVVAANGLEAWDLFELHQPDVVISDWRMPGLDGPELCRRVRSAEGLRYTPFIFVTGLTDREHALVGMEVGADDVLGKPLDVHELRARLLTAARHKRTEQEIRTLNADLERRVAERTIELQHANQELEAFAYTIAHDLQAPLRAIHGFSSILLQEHADLLAEDGRQCLGVIGANAKHMGRLIDDLLAFSRLGQQGLTKQLVRVDDVVRQALADIASDQTDRRVDITIGKLPHSLADSALLRQVFVNLLSNALKYSRRREVTSIEVGHAETEAGLVYWVRDNGVGFDMRYAHRLFGVFERLHRAEDYEGTGLGLALVQRIVHRHGGRIWAESVPDQGATFYFTLGGSRAC